MQQNPYRKPTPARRARLSLILSGALALLATGLGTTRFHENFQDFRFQHQRTPHRSSNILILKIDQDSIDYFSKQQYMPWPWYRQIYAGIIGPLEHCGARAIIFDMLFTESSPYGASDDDKFAQALAASTRVVLASLHQGASSWLDPIPKFAKHVKLGAVNATPDADGVHRSAVLQLHGRPGLAMAAAHLAGVQRPKLPGRLKLRFYRPPANAHVFREYSFSELFTDGAPSLENLDAAMFRGKFVFIAPTAPGLLDHKPTPVDDRAPGVMVHATALENMLLDDYLLEPPLPLQFLMLFVVGFATCQASLWRNRFHSMAGAAGIVLACATAFFLIPIPIVLPFAGMALLILLGLLCTQMINHATEGRHKREIKKMFSHYLDHNLVQQLIDNPDLLKLGGEKKEMTVLFSDLEGFSTFAETMDPSRLIQFLNEYLGAMTLRLLEHRAYVDKYEGDAMMAFWGAPVPDPAHALHACRAALASQEELKTLNDRFQQQGWPTLKCRIGINTGFMVAGNMGADLGEVKKLSYTVMGDAVNMASRLEGVNKEYATCIIIGETTYGMVKDLMICRALDTIRVKGKNIPESIYELVGERKQGHAMIAQWVDSYHDAWALYQQKKFQEALENFQSILRLQPEDGPTLRMIARCKRYLKHPPPADWDGVHTMTSK